MAEVISASQGAFGITPQQYDQSDGSCKGIALPASPTWHWYSAVRVGFGLAQVMGGLPPAIAQSILPRGQYKDGLYPGGMVELVPSLVNDFGWLLQGLSGIFNYGVQDGVADAGVSLLTVQGAYPNTTANAGVFVHNWVPDADRTLAGYFHSRKILPGRGTQSLGEEVSDVRVTGGVFNLPNTGLFTAQMGFAGITPAFDSAPAWSPSYDDEQFAVVSHESSFVSLEVNSVFVEVPCVGATVSFDNGVAPGTAMRVIGNPYAYDLPLFGPRSMSARVAIMIDTSTAGGYELYSWLMANVALASMATWSSTPYKADLHLRVVSPFAIPGAAIAGTPYTFEVITVGGNCVYSIADAMELRAGGPVIMTLDIVPQEITATADTGTATGGSATTVIDAAGGWTQDAFIGYTVEIATTTDGLAPQGQRRIIKSNDATTLTVDTNFPFSAVVAADDTYKIYPPPWIVRLQNAVASYAWPVVA